MTDPVTGVLEIPKKYSKDAIEKKDIFLKGGKIQYFSPRINDEDEYDRDVMSSAWRSRKENWRTK